jgi:hypothetical protein
LGLEKRGTPAYPFLHFICAPIAKGTSCELLVSGVRNKGKDARRLMHKHLEHVVAEKLLAVDLTFVAGTVDQKSRGSYD